MSRTKYIISFASVGFVLSFIIGLFSSVPFGIILLRALISALVMACVYFAGSVIFDKFLDANGSVTETTPKKIKTTGNADVSLDDSLIFDEENGPEFRIPKQLMNEGVSEPKKPAAKQESSASASNAESVSVTTAEVPPVEPKAESAPVKTEPAAENFISVNDTESADNMELGSLPDIDTMLTDMKKLGSDVITNSDFAKSEATAGSEELKGADTEIMARAIHTVLTRDNG
ncbi:MAG: hypothetical protein J6Y75_02130 [Spirochaetaceae bacterium]|nr:hypothetical protein [Spirochaetaceae bacterium]